MFQGGAAPGVVVSLFMFGAVRLGFNRQKNYIIDGMKWRIILNLAGFACGWQRAWSYYV